MARQFDGGADQKVSTPFAIGSYEVTLALWLYVADGDFGAVTHIFTTGDGDGLIGWGDSLALRFTGANPGKLWASSFNSAIGVGQALSSEALVADAWNHACGVFVSDTDRRVFLNGNKDTDSTDIDPGFANHDETRLGTSLDAPNSFFTGRMAECGMWNVALTDAEAGALAAGATPLMVRPESLVGYWPLHGRTGRG